LQIVGEFDAVLMDAACIGMPVGIPNVTVDIGGDAEDVVAIKLLCRLAESRVF
jgi:hypothetical protein